MSQNNARIIEPKFTIIDSASVFSNQQRRILKAIINEISDLQDLNNGYDIIESFEERINKSDNLSSNEKIQLLQFTSSTQALLEFMLNGGWHSIYAQLAEEIDQDPTVYHCDLKWRNIWAGAVVGFSLGAVKGAISGATGGTVVIPGLGTATGAVGGAVFGGAIGFISGATTTITASLITTCFRPTTTGQHTTSCNQLYDYYLQGWVYKIPEDCYTVIYENLKCC